MELILRTAKDEEFFEAHQLIQEYMDSSFTKEIFEWKHLKNPVGKSVCIVAVENDKMIGFNFFSPHQIKSDKQTFLLYRSSESLVLPEGRGKGVFTRIQDYFNTNFKQNTAGVFGTPNANSIKIFQKIGWKTFEVKVNFYFNIPLGYSGKAVLSDGLDNRFDINFESKAFFIDYDFNWRTDIINYKVATLDDAYVVYEVLTKKGLNIIKLLYKSDSSKQLQKLINTIQIKEKSLLLLDIGGSKINHIYKKKSSSYDFGYMLFDDNTKSLDTINLSLGDLDKIF